MFPRFSDEVFYAAWERYQYLSSSKVTAQEARALYLREVEDGVFWRECLDGLLHLYRTYEYCSSDGQESAYELQRQWDNVYYGEPRYDLHNASMMDALEEWLEEERDGD